jgi:DNA-binding transcriptional LysR family regulator
MEREPFSMRDLGTFVTVADCGGLAKAAEALGYTQPAVSLQLQRLQRRLDAELLERRGRSLVLTPLGHHVLERARTLLRQAAEFEQDAASGSMYRAESIVIGALEPTASAKLVSVLGRFRERAPRAGIRIESLGGDNIAKAAESGTIDAALTVPTQISGWVYEPLFKERLALLVRADSQLALQKSVSLSRIAQEPLLLTDGTCVYRRTIERAMARRNAAVAPAIQTSSLLSLPGAVSAGLGIAIVPRNVPGAQSNALRFIAIREPVEMTIGLLRPKNVVEQSALAEFIAVADELRRS